MGFSFTRRGAPGVSLLIGLAVLAICGSPLRAQTPPAAGVEVRMLVEQGRAAAKARRDEEAGRLYQQALELARSQKDRAGEYTALLAQGDLQRDLGDMRKAIPLYEQMVPLARDAGDRRMQMFGLINLSRCHAELRENTKAGQYLEQARLLAKDLGDQKNEAILLHNLGGLYLYQGKPRDALNAMSEALTLFETLGQKNEAASCLSNLSVISFRLGEFLNSLDYAQRSLERQRALGSQGGMASAHASLATYYSYFGQYELALEHQQQALTAVLQTSNLQKRALIVGDLGRILGQLERYPEERTAVEQSLALNRQLGDKYGQAFDLHYLSGNLVHTGDPARALTAEEEARSLFHEIKDAHGEGAALEQLGDLASGRGEPESALDYYRQALVLFQSIGYAYGESNVMARIGEEQESQGRLKDAESAYMQALGQKELLRTNLGGLTETKLSYLEKEFPLYQRFIRLLLRMGDRARAFEWVQKSKARVLTDLMSAGKVDLSPPLTEAEKQREDALKRRDRELSRQWLAALQVADARGPGTEPDRRKVQEVEKQRQTVRQAQRQLERDWRGFSESVYLRNAHLAPLRPASPVTLEELSHTLPADAALLEYAVLGFADPKAARSALSPRGKAAGQPGKPPTGKSAVNEATLKEEAALFVVTSQAGKPRLTVHRILTERGVLSRMPAELRGACAGRPGTASERPFQQLARRFYQTLVAPAAPELAGKRRLVVCPDGPLWDVPFQALLVPPTGGKSGAAAFLWERYDLSYAASATGLEALREAEHRPGRGRAAQPLLVLADPSLGSPEPGPATGTQTASRRLYDRAGLGPLPSTRVEASAIRASFPEAAVKLEDDAQESLVKQTGPDYRYLHLAAHALFNDAAPMLSGVVLARPPQGSKEDGILTVRELFDMKLKADLMVLSACDTARGTRRSGEGVIGLTWGMSAAGVPTQVVSQWSVDDAATAQLMGGFYRGLKRGGGKEAALRASALSLLKDGKHSHPFYWAPFLLIGDWR